MLCPQQDLCYVPRCIYLTAKKDTPPSLLSSGWKLWGPSSVSKCDLTDQKVIMIFRKDSVLRDPAVFGTH